MTNALGSDFAVLPADWPGPNFKGIRPGDLSKFAPQGLAMAPPPIIMPYGGLPDADYYGAQDTITHPIKSAPINDDVGGVIYFSPHNPNTEIMKVLDLIGIKSLMTDYAVFIDSSPEPKDDGYLDQMRLISHPALKHFFRIDVSELAAQKCDVGAAVSRFLDWQRDKWGGGSTLSGCLGGDGDWAKERLAFGALIENAYWGIARVWSRAWLITK